MYQDIAARATVWIGFLSLSANALSKCVVGRPVGTRVLEGYSDRPSQRIRQPVTTVGSPFSNPR